MVGEEGGVGIVLYWPAGVAGLLHPRLGGYMILGDAESVIRWAEGM